ncbi:hypothetical protein B296_00027079 [Ensete ventricosum]|uniref:Uncharacterized protein n=1 Tax=Ensete ventricosum TaxID=4639 RepID=A0A426Z2G7_ENSVE|nr:hypothetical protein B296_00027079 [Ensete ventricosum]
MHLEFILMHKENGSYYSEQFAPDCSSEVLITSANSQVEVFDDLKMCVVHVGREVRRVRRRRLARVRVEAAAGAAVAPEELRNIYLGPGIGSDSFASSIPWTPAPSSLVVLGTSQRGQQQESVERLESGGRHGRSGWRYQDLSEF